MKIILNAREIEVEQKELPYSTICHLAEIDPFLNPTVVYAIKGKGIGGSLTDGRTLAVVEGLIINANITNKA